MNTTKKRLHGCGNLSRRDSFPLAMSIRAQSTMSDPMKSHDTHSNTSSPESADGHLLCASRGGQTTDLFGLDHVPASRSASRAKAKEKPMNGTSGQCSVTSSPSANLQSRLASKLRARLAVNGSPMFALTWKDWDMPWGPPICALRASVRRTSDKDCSGWQTPRARGDAGGSRWKTGYAKNLEDQARIYALMRGLTVSDVAALSVSPMFCRRLMGYPAAWDSCGVTAMLSSPKSRRSSSPRSLTAKPSPAGLGQASAG